MPRVCSDDYTKNFEVIRTLIDMYGDESSYLIICTSGSRSTQPTHGDSVDQNEMASPRGGLTGAPTRSVSLPLDAFPPSTPSLSKYD